MKYMYQISSSTPTLWSTRFLSMKYMCQISSSTPTLWSTRFLLFKLKAARLLCSISTGIKKNSVRTSAKRLADKDGFCKVAFSKYHFNFKHPISVSHEQVIDQNFNLAPRLRWEKPNKIKKNVRSKMIKSDKAFLLLSPSKIRNQVRI